MPRTLGAIRALAVGAVFTATLAGTASVGLAQGDDLCGVVTTDELANAIPGTYDAPAGFSGSCQWHGTSPGGDSIDLIAYEVPGSVADFAAMGTPVTIADLPAVVMPDPSMATPTQVVAVELGDGLLLLTVSTADGSVDLEAAAVGLATIAIGRAAAGNTSGTTDEATDGTGATDGVEICGLATPEEVAAAAGLDVKLVLEDAGLYCNYEGGKDDKHVMIYVTTQDAGTFDGMVASVGATEVEGPGDSSWWWKDYASLFTRQGDLVLQVAITADRQPSEGELQAMAVAVMEALLAP